MSEFRKRNEQADNPGQGDASQEKLRKPMIGLDRRKVLFSAAATAAASLASSPASAADKKAPPGATLYDVPVDAAKEMATRGVFSDDGYGTRSQFDTAVRAKAENRPFDNTSWTFTPLASMIGNLTPSGLHFERHHGGIPTIDPARHELYVHGLVNVAKKFSYAELINLPSITRKYFIECSGNTLGEWSKPTGKNVQFTHGLLSTSEWTGVPFSTLARAVGLKEGGAWVLAEGGDAAVMTRSIPLEKLLSDGLIAYGQNGEALRPEQGYPLRLILPGYEGNTQIKWLRRLQIGTGAFYTHEETAAYTDLMKDGRAKLFTLDMAAKSVITFPSGEMKLPAPGSYTIRGIAWTGHGRVKAVEVSLDGGQSWVQAKLDDTPEPMCTVRFSFSWVWNGGPAILQSRCIDETNYVQPNRTALVALRGVNSVYHYNAIQSWAVAADGSVTNVHV